MASVLVDGGDHVRREVDDLLEVLRGEVEQVAEPARDTLKYQMCVTGGEARCGPSAPRRNSWKRVTSPRARR